MAGASSWQNAHDGFMPSAAAARRIDNLQLLHNMKAQADLESGSAAKLANSSCSISLWFVTRVLCPC